MKSIYVIVVSLLSVAIFSQSNEKLQQNLLINIYGNTKKVINYDKSFVSDDKLFYESLGKIELDKESFSDEVLIKHTLLNYIQGSSYNQIGRLMSAFSDDATLYLKDKNNLLKVISPSTYVSWFQEGVSGKFNGRFGKILSIDTEGDIATAKVEILIPNKNSRYVDLFLLSKKHNGWKIISKTASSFKSMKKGDKVLFFVSNSHFYGNSKLGTGNSYSEIVEAYDEFVNAGYDVDFVSPNGGAVSLAYINTSNSIAKKYLYDIDFMYALKNTISPKDVIVKDYRAVYYVGGGSAMFGVPMNEEIQNIAMQVYEKNKGIIAAVCHGTAGIVNLKTSKGEYLVKGKRVSGYPEEYESKEKPYFKTFPFLIKKTIENRGGFFKFSPKSTAHIEVDGRLITGQNFLSSRLVAKKIIEKLNAK